MKLDAADLAFLEWLIEKATETFFPPLIVALSSFATAREETDQSRSCRLLTTAQAAE